MARGKGGKGEWENGNGGEKDGLSRWAVSKSKIHEVNGAEARDEKNGRSERRRSAFPFFRVPERSRGPAGSVLIFWF